MWYEILPMNFKWDMCLLNYLLIIKGLDLYLLIIANPVTGSKECKIEQLVNLLYFLNFLSTPPYSILAICIC